MNNKNPASHHLPQVVTMWLTITLILGVTIFGEAMKVNFLGIEFGCTEEECNARCSGSGIRGTQWWNHGTHPTGRGECYSVLWLRCRCIYPTTKYFKGMDPTEVDHASMDTVLQFIQRIQHDQGGGPCPIPRLNEQLEAEFGTCDMASYCSMSSSDSEFS